jgi:aminopeptidase N
VATGGSAIEGRHSVADQPGRREPAAQGAFRHLAWRLAIAAGLVVAACSNQGPATGNESATSGAVPGRGGAGEAVAGSTSLDDPYVGSFGNGGYDVGRYDLTLDWHPDTARLDGLARIEATATATLSSFNLDLISLEVEAVTVDGTTAAFEHAGSELMITPAGPLAAGEGFVAEITYGGSPSDDGDPASSDPSGWHTRSDYAFVAGEPVSAASFHPANDHPSDKAAFRFTISAPEALTVAANGSLASTDTAGGRTTWVYDAPDPQATYLTTVLIGDFEVLDDGMTSGGVAIRNVVDTDLLAVGREAFAAQGRMIDAFEPLFGPYPFDVYGSALVKDGSFGGALETQTLSVFGEDAADSEELVAHELAHQWFGNNVTLERWEDLWLNEGFATYAEALWLEASDPDFTWERWIEDVVSHGPDLGQPIQPAPTDLFANVVYLRGALAVHALRVEVGDGTFFEILRAWNERFAGGNASTADFQSLAGELSGRNLDTLFDQWLRQPELPASLGGVPIDLRDDDE